MKKSIGALFVLLAAGLLAACNGNNGGSAPPVVACGPPPAANQLEVLYPKPGAMNAPVALATIFVSTKGTLPPNNQFNFYLVQANGSSTFTSPFFATSASKIPSPHGKPTYPNPTYYATSLPASYTIGPNQTVSLLWNDGGTGCTPRFVVSSFSTGSSGPK